jgi:hypothetical protein
VRFSQSEEVAPGEWWYFLGWSLAIGAALIAFTHLLESTAVNSDNQIWRAVVVGFGLMLGGLGIALLAWVYWQIQLDPEDRKPYFIALLSSVATVGICTAAFAGLTTILYQAGAIIADSGSEAVSLWTVETYYLWHLVETVPLLGATQILHWDRPVAFTDPWSGALLLAFKILLLIPLVRVILSGFRLLQSRLLSVIERSGNTWPGLLRRAEFFSRDEMSPTSSPVLSKLIDMAWGLWFVVLVIAPPLFAYGILTLAVRQDSPLDQWLEQHVPVRVDLLVISIPTSWFPIALDVAATWLIVASVWSIGDEAIGEYDYFFGRYSPRRILGGILLSCWVLLLAIAAASSITLTLLHAGLARTDSPLPPTEEVNASIQWYAWHLAEAIPVLDATQTLNWSIQIEFLDRWTGLLLMLLRIGLILILLVPVVLFTRLAVRYAVRRRQTSRQLDAAARFLETLDEAQSHLDQVQHEILHRKGERGYAFNEYGLINLMLPQLERKLEQVLALLGEGTAMHAGHAAIAAWTTRVAALRDADHLYWARDDPSVEIARKSLEESRLAAVTQRNVFVELTRDTLRSAGKGL